MLSRNGKNKKNGDFDWSDAIADAAIMAGSTFFLSLTAMAATGLAVVDSKAYLSALLAAGGEFCAILAVKRGLREKAKAT